MSVSPVFAGDTGLVTCTGLDCDFCKFAEMVGRVKNYLVGLLVLCATILLAWTGVQMAMSAGSSDAMQLLKDRLTNIVIGFILILAATTIVDTLIKALVTDGQLREAWSTPWSALCGEMREPQHSFVREGADGDAGGDISGGEGAGTVVGGGRGDSLNPTYDAIPEGTLTQAEAEAILAGHPIEVTSSGTCIDRNVPTCTSLSGIRPTTLERIIAFQEEVGQLVVITGATETGHDMRLQYTHWDGYKLDLSTQNETINSYIRNNYEPLGGNKWRDPYGNVWYRHGPVDHWDVTITR